MKKNIRLGPGTHPFCISSFFSSSIIFLEDKFQIGNICYWKIMCYYRSTALKNTGAKNISLNKVLQNSVS